MNDGIFLIMYGADFDAWFHNCKDKQECMTIMVVNHTNSPYLSPAMQKSVKSLRLRQQVNYHRGPLLSLQVGTAGKGDGESEGRCKGKCWGNKAPPWELYI